VPAEIIFNFSSKHLHQPEKIFKFTNGSSISFCSPQPQPRQRQILFIYFYFHKYCYHN
jgi:hypothetical protein